MLCSVRTLRGRRKERKKEGRGIIIAILNDLEKYSSPHNLKVYYITLAFHTDNISFHIETPNEINTEVDRGNL